MRNNNINQNILGHRRPLHYFAKAYLNLAVQSQIADLGALRRSFAIFLRNQVFFSPCPEIFFQTFINLILSIDDHINIISICSLNLANDFSKSMSSEGNSHTVNKQHNLQEVCNQFSSKYQAEHDEFYLLAVRSPGSRPISSSPICLSASTGNCSDCLSTNGDRGFF